MRGSLLQSGSLCLHARLRCMMTQKTTLLQTKTRDIWLTSYQFLVYVNPTHYTQSRFLPSSFIITKTENKKQNKKTTWQKEKSFWSYMQVLPIIWRAHWQMKLLLHLCFYQPYCEHSQASLWTCKIYQRKKHLKGLRERFHIQMTYMSVL